ncbi:hypothetical protein ElyMa_003390800 [Elysia marginata]|uniref:Uncharacterized protein n=1 Tax=Elysia marginata TaxID=1093978 RepID=A0AAV4JQ36_9GAST|nr:hypothetical protein ElyMa_003390800 [Elysia marginata]
MQESTITACTRWKKRLQNQHRWTPPGLQIQHQLPSSHYIHCFNPRKMIRIENLKILNGPGTLAIGHSYILVYKDDTFMKRSRNQNLRSSFALKPLNVAAKRKV